MKLNKCFLCIIFWLFLAADLFVLFVLDIAACGKTPIPPSPTAVETSLSFSTIERTTIGSGNEATLYEGRDPRLIVIDHTEDIALLDDTVTKQAQDLLQNTDYSQFFVAAIYQGWKGVMNDEITVQSVILQNNQVIINATFVQPKPGEGQLNVITSPYYVLRIYRKGLQGDIDIVVKNGSRMVLLVTHTFY